MYLIKQFFCRLLMLLMVFSPLQITLAADIEPHEHAMSCQPISSVQQMEHQHDHGCVEQHEENCIDHPGCVIQFNLSSLLDSGSFQSLLNKPLLIKINADNDALPSHYLELPRRPPKIKAVKG